MISIIIPTFNEAQKIGGTLSKLWAGKDKEFIEEIIIADGGSTDNTIEIAKNGFAKTIEVQGKSRAAQLNAGAAIAKGQILFFLHADSIPPAGFLNEIIAAVNNNYHSGCFRLSFDYGHWFLRANAWFTKFNVNAFRFGDQGLFVTREVFKKCNGYREDLALMDDQEIIHRLKKFSTFKVIQAFVTTSARKYRQYGIYTTQVKFFTIWLMYYLGMPQNKLLKLYRKLFSSSRF